MNKHYEISKIYPTSCYKEKIREQGTLACIHKRCQGETTGRALAIISDAMQSTHKAIPYGDDTDKRTKVLSDTITALIQKLELKFLDLNKSKCTLTYNIYNSVLVTDDNKIYLEI